MPTSKGIPGLPANSSPFSPPSAAPPSEEELGWGPAGVGLRHPVPGPWNSSGSGNCTSSGQDRPGPGPAGWEPQERERAEEGEEEGKEEEEEERSSQQARGGRTSWRGGCQQPRKRKTERSGGRPSGATRKETWESHSPRRPPRRLHLQGRGLRRPLPHRSADPWGFGGRAWAPPRRRGFLLFWTANFPRRCLSGRGAAPEEDRPASNCRLRPRAAGATRPRGRDNPTS